MATVTYGGKGGTKLTLVESSDHLVVRTENRDELKLTPLSMAARSTVDEFEVVARFRRAGVEVLRAKTATRTRALRDEARATLKKEPAIASPAGDVDKVSDERSSTRELLRQFYDDQSVACQAAAEDMGSR